MIKTIKKILQSHISSSWKLNFFSIILFSFLVAVLTVLEPYAFTKIIVEIENYLKTWEFDWDKISNNLFIWFLLIITTIIFQYIHRYFFVYKLNQKNYINLCQKFNSKIVYMKYSEYLWKKHWSLYKIYDRWTDWQERFLYFIFWDFVKNIFWILIIVAIIVSINLKMALIALSMLPVMIIIWIFSIKILSKKQRKLNDKWDSMYWTIWNILSSFMLTKSLHIENRFLKNMSSLLDKVLIKQNNLGKQWSFVNIYTVVLTMISRILVLGFWVYLVIDSQLLFSELFLIFAYIWWIYFPIGFMIDRFNDMVKNITSVEKMYDEFDWLKKEDIYSWKKIKNFKWDIEFKNIDFSYIKNKMIIKNLNLKIKQSEKIALVWNTWSWKSTIVNLLLRFWEPNKWWIYLDSENIANLSKKSLRSHIWVVAQDNSLFNLSIKENLLFANPKATNKDLEKALKKAEAYFVFSLKNWINTVIGERGLKLSWWEKQRISIARLFLKNPKILILDEATSALDNKTEKLIQKALDKLMKWRTSIVIAHRLSTIQNADKIFMLENWKIVEQWKYDELMNKKGKFYNLANPNHLIIN